MVKSVVLKRRALDIAQAIQGMSEGPKQMKRTIRLQTHAQQLCHLGYFSGSDYLNHVRAAPASLYGAPLQGRASFALMGAAEVLAAADVMDLTTFGNDAILVRGGFDSSPPYASFTSRVERLPHRRISGSRVRFHRTLRRCGALPGIP